jgi:hypothetical protein
MASNNHEEFISRSAFRKLAAKKTEEERDVKCWSELLVDGTIYKIIDSKQVRGKYGDCHILTFKNKFGEESKVWTPKNLQREIDTEAKKTNPRSIYFCSLGQNKIQDGSGRVKNEYESCYK